jgi:hypothetical protein
MPRLATLAVEVLIPVAERTREPLVTLAPSPTAALTEPARSALAVIKEILTTPPEAPLALAVALLVPVAVTETGAPSAVIDADDPIEASTIEAEVTSASASAPAPEIAPIAKVSAVDVAVLKAVVCTLILEAWVTVPLNDAFVPPAILALGSLTSIANKPPVPPSELASAVFPELASDCNSPLVWTVAVAAAVELVSAVERISASVPAPLRPATPIPTKVVVA